MRCAILNFLSGYQSRYGVVPCLEQAVPCIDADATRGGGGMQTIGTIVRRWREQRGWEQKELARRAGVSPSYVSRLEAGLMKEPGVEKLLVICRAFGRPIADLMHESGMELAPRTPQSLTNAALELFRQLSPESRESVLEQMELLLIRDRQRREKANHNNVTPISG